MHRRNDVLARIRPFLGKPVVKVLIGMRRVGKSCLLRQVIDEAVATGLDRDNVLLIDKELLDFEDLANHRHLAARIERDLGRRRGPKLVAIDEVQEIAGWEKALASLLKHGGIDLIVTGSNAHLLSSELATLLAGRCVTIPVQPLGLAEFLQFRGADRSMVGQELRRYLRYGGLPGLHHLELEDEVVVQYLGSIFDSVLLKDIIARHQVRNVPLLTRIARFLCDSTGSVLSAKRIADYLKSQRLQIGVETVQAYLGHFLEAQVAQRVQRFDLRGRRFLEIHEKYYLTDLGLRQAVLGYREGNLGAILENAVFLELRRRGYDVSIGKLGDLEIDFIATRAQERLYVQVAYLLNDPATVEREIRGLRLIDDNYPKLLVSLDETFGADLHGIRRLHLADFLLDPWPA